MHVHYSLWLIRSFEIEEFKLIIGRFVWNCEPIFDDDALTTSPRSYLKFYKLKTGFLHDERAEEKKSLMPTDDINDI